MQIYQLKPQWTLSTVAGENVVLPTDPANEDFHGMLTLNATAATLWRALEQGATEADLVRQLQETYTVPQATAQKDVAEFLGQMAEKGWLR